MIRTVLTAAFLLTLPTVTHAIPVMPYIDTPSFAKQATEVVIADCRNPDADGEPHDDGLTLVDVDVVKTLKGSRKLGPAKLVTIGQPMEKGNRYMMVSFGGMALGSDFVANGELAVVGVPAGFELKSLDGKGVAVQMQLVFNARRANVAAALRLLEAEKAGLEKTAAKVEANDRWVGEYHRLGGWEMAGRGQHVAITPDGDGYRISLKGYETFKFLEVKPGVLECKSLGTITRGTVKFEGRDSLPVLTADFCYEQFYLFGPAPK